MKNIFYEAAKRNFKKTINRQNQLVNGINCNNLFDLSIFNNLSWYKQFEFKLNDYLVFVEWSHPRMVYSDYIKEAAHEKVKNLKEWSDTNFSDTKMSPIYKYQGNSRKKIAFYKDESDEYDNLRYKSLFSAIDQLRYSATFTITPNYSAVWSNEKRIVSICTPDELLSYDDVVRFSMFIKKLLKREVTLDQAYGSYSYNRQDWLKDNSNLNNGN